MIVSTVCGVLAIVMFFLASRGDIGGKSTLLGGAGLVLVIIAILSTPAVLGESDCIRYSSFVDVC